MTYPYEWNPIPHFADVSCPSCGGNAKFEFAEVVEIRRWDALYFQKSELFEYKFVQAKKTLLGRLPGTYVRPGDWHAAIYYHGQHRHSLSSVQDLPDGYSSEDWKHSKYWARGVDAGTVTCSDCHKRQKHILSWPEDAFYQTEVRGQVLWAFNRESLVALRDYLASTERDKARQNTWKNFLLNVPTYFLKAKVRDEAVKKLNRLLSS